MCINDLTTAFKNGIKNKGLSMKDLQKYKWAGLYHCKPEEATKKHIVKGRNRYFHTIGYNKDGTKKTPPDDKDYCVCGQKIIYQNYIFNFEEYDINEEENEIVPLQDYIKLNILMVVGSCCIKKFMDGGLHNRCDFCDDNTKNREKKYLANNVLRLCNNCRPDKNLNINIKCCMCKCKKKGIVVKNKQFICSLCDKGYYNIYL